MQSSNQDFNLEPREYEAGMLNHSAATFGIQTLRNPWSYVVAEICKLVRLVWEGCSQ
jgi:hypothetical protein